MSVVFNSAEQYGAYTGTQVRDILDYLGAPHESWGAKGYGSKTFEDLLERLRQGEADIEATEGGEIFRTTRVVGINVCHIGPTGRLHYLTEAYRIHKKDGRREERALANSIGETISATEDPEGGARRGLREELGILGCAVLVLANERTSGAASMDSAAVSFPGLPPQYRFYNFLCLINDDDYRPEGYVEDGPKRTTYFEWRTLTG